MITEDLIKRIPDSINEMIFIINDASEVIWHNNAVKNVFSSRVKNKKIDTLTGVTIQEIAEKPEGLISPAIGKKNLRYYLKHRIIKLEKGIGEAAFLIISEDITEKHQNQQLMNSMLQFEKLMTAVALESGNIPQDDIDRNLDKILMTIGNFSGVDRCYIALLDKYGKDLTVAYNWNSSAFKPSRNRVRMKDVPYNWSRKKRTEIIAIPDVKNVKYPEGTDYKNVFSSNTVSSLLVPIYRCNRLAGYLGISSAKKIPSFPKELISTFKITAEIITNLLDKKEYTSEIELNRIILSKTAGMMAYTDIEGHVLFSNDSFRKFHKLDTAEKSEPLLPDLYKNYIISGEEIFFKAFKKSQQGCETKTEIWIKNGISMRLLEISFTPVMDGEDSLKGIIFNSDDITDKVQLEARILEVIHTERKKIGISLHDDLGHDLLAVAIKARLLRDRIQAISPETAEEISAIEKGIKAGIDEVRRLARGLIPYKNSGLDFNEMIDAIALTIERDYKLSCSFNIEPDLNITDESVIKELFYIIEEAVMNAVKHSDCTRIKVRFYRESSLNVMEISDNGRGIQESSNIDSGVGLEIMKYRARTLGGDLRIENNPEKGAVIKCCFSPEKLNPE